MSLIKKVTPLNLLQEKGKFFSDQTYNPQFIYENKLDDKTLSKYGLPQPQYLDLAKTILNKVGVDHSKESFNKLNGQLLTQKEVTQKTRSFLEIHQLQDRFKIVWSKSFVARATMTSDTIKLKQGAEFRTLDLLSMLYHEIGTHGLRRINYEQQPWYRKKKKYNFENYLKTEEGLAGLHSLFPLDFQYAYYPALSYVSVAYANEHSFAETWDFLTQYIDNLEKRWEKTFRYKRGLMDTSKSGGFTKDLVYFEGMIEVWNYLKRNDFNLSKLYLGKMSWQDVDQAVKMNPDFKPLLPSFYTVDTRRYAKRMLEIGKVNMF